jgi:hypothetical protein
VVCAAIFYRKVSPAGIEPTFKAATSGNFLSLVKRTLLNIIDGDHSHALEGPAKKHGMATHSKAFLLVRPNEMERRGRARVKVICLGSVVRGLKLGRPRVAIRIKLGARNY